MKQILNYNIYDILKFQIIRKQRYDFMKDLNLEYSYFEVDKIDIPDIILNIGKFVPSNEDCYLIDHKYYIKNNYLYCNDSERNAKWEVEIYGFDSGMATINFNSHETFGTEILFPDRKPQNTILQPLIEYKLCQKGYLLIHSTGIGNDNKGYVLAGRPGAFKSTIAMDFVRKKGYNCFGDDRVIINNDKILNYPVSPITFDFKCKYLETEELNGFYDKINLIRYLLCNKYKSNSMPKSYLLESLFFVSKTNKEIMKKDIDMHTAIDKLIENNKAEMMLLHFYKYILAYSFVFPDNNISKHWNCMKIYLEKFLKDIPIYEIEIPERYESNVFRELFKMMIS